MITATLPGTLIRMGMTEELADTWRAIRRNDRSIPMAAFEIVPGDPAVCAWSTDWGTTPVLRITTGTIETGPGAVLGFMLHQAAHAIVAGKGEIITRFHPGAFRTAARSLGLDAVRPEEEMTARNRGWSLTTVPAATADDYAAQLQALALAIHDWEPPARSSAKRSGSNGAVARCACPDGLTVRIRGIDAAERLEDHPMRCEICGQPFRVKAPATR